MLCSSILCFPACLLVKFLRIFFRYYSIACGVTPANPVCSFSSMVRNFWRHTFRSCCLILFCNWTAVLNSFICSSHLFFIKAWISGVAPGIKEQNCLGYVSGSKSVFDTLAYFSLGNIRPRCPKCPPPLVEYISCAFV